MFNSIKKPTLLITVLICTIFICWFCKIPVAFGGQKEGKVVLLLVDKMSAYDLKDYRPQQILDLASEGSLGLINTKTLGEGAEDAFLTLGAGIPIKAGAKSLLGFN